MVFQNDSLIPSFTIVLATRTHNDAPRRHTFFWLSPDTFLAKTGPEDMRYGYYGSGGAPVSEHMNPGKNNT
jgi:hypothetical protein